MFLKAISGKVKNMPIENNKKLNEKKRDSTTHTIQLTIDMDSLSAMIAYHGNIHIFLIYWEPFIGDVTENCGN